LQLACRLCAPEHGSNLKHSVKVSADGHLLVQLRALGKAARTPHVVKPEYGRKQQQQQQHNNSSIPFASSCSKIRLKNVPDATAPAHMSVLQQPSSSARVSNKLLLQLVLSFLHHPQAAIT
jgi:hypothetical protein